MSIDKDRVLNLNKKSFEGKAVVYVMSRDQRLNDNQALLAAQEFAYEHKLPLYILFVVKRVAGRSKEHYQFMLSGLKELVPAAEKLNINFVIRRGNPTNAILDFAKEVEAGAIYFDFSPLKGARRIVDVISNEFKGSINLVDAHNIVPLWIASNKQEFAAHTMRRKIHKHLQDYLVEPGSLTKHPFKGKSVETLSNSQIEDFLKSIPQSKIKIQFKSGEEAAKKHLVNFIKNGLFNYPIGRNDISQDLQSNLSPYLHFGQISSLRVALDVINSVNKAPLLFKVAKLQGPSGKPSIEDGMNALMEEMVVRKELSDNFCFYNQNYKNINGAPLWALESLKLRSVDKREFLYNQDQWEAANTHDTIWNAAQIELVTTGKMHGYMRMYWAKKILEWSKSAKVAVETAIYLNDKYSIDGGDPNGYVGILWSIAGLHDRPWFERPVFGKIRYMNDSGLRRKFDVEAYIKRVNKLG